MPVQSFWSRFLLDANVYEHNKGLRGRQGLGLDSLLDVLINFLSVNDTQNVNLITGYSENNAIVSYP